MNENEQFTFLLLPFMNENEQFTFLLLPFMNENELSLCLVYFASLVCNFLQTNKKKKYLQKIDAFGMVPTV